MKALKTIVLILFAIPIFIIGALAEVVKQNNN
jgi:hypothetical protein